MLQLFLAALAAPPGVSVPNTPMASDFDLSKSAMPAKSRERTRTEIASEDPAMPASMRVADLEAPEVELSFADNGPAVLVGAFGGRRSGMPRLAHVGLDWTF